MRFWTCFECGKYTEIKSTARHAVPWTCEHKIYTYDRETSDHEDLEEVRPELKDVSATAYPVKNKIVYPLSAITDSGLLYVDVGDTLEEKGAFPRVPDSIEVTGLIRHWDRVEVLYEAAGVTQA